MKKVVALTRFEVKCPECRGYNSYDYPDKQKCIICGAEFMVQAENIESVDARKYKDLIKELWAMWENMSEAGELKISVGFSDRYERLKKQVDSI